MESRYTRRVRVLSDSDIRKIDESARKLLFSTGIDAGGEPFLEIFSSVGAEVQRNGRVTFPPSVIDRALETVPQRIQLYGRGAAPMLHLGDEEVYLGTGGAAVHILDIVDGRVREPTLADLADIAWLVENLESIHFFLRPVVAKDVHPEILDVNKYYVSLANTTKHVMGSAGSPESALDVIEMAALISGGEAALIERPIVSFVTSWMISPLTLDRNVSKVLTTVAERRIPVALSIAPVAGSTAPATLAGVLTLAHAEELSGIVLAQAVCPGAPVLYGPVPAVADFHTMNYASGAIESALLNAGCVELARFVGIPVYADAGLTDSKLPDIQAGYEKASNILLLALAGGHYIHHTAGMLESMLTVAYEQYVIDNDINAMALRVLRGIRVDEETLAGEVVADVGPGGNFLTHPHTVHFIRTDEFLVLKTSDRGGRSAWVEKGAVDARGRAREIAQGILNCRRPLVLPPDVDREIRNRFPIVWQS